MKQTNRTTVMDVDITSNPVWSHLAKVLDAVEFEALIELYALSGLSNGKLNHLNTDKTIRHINTKFGLGRIKAPRLWRKLHLQGVCSFVEVSSIHSDLTKSIVVNPHLSLNNDGERFGFYHVMSRTKIAQLTT